MLDFSCDYSEFCHLNVLKRIEEVYKEKNITYGFDEYSESAKNRIKKAFALGGDSRIYFLAGGTITNKVAIDVMLKSYEAVIALDTAHINTHEAGAIESIGHKIITLKNKNGKMDSNDLEKFMDNYVNDETIDHIATPKLVYISNSTEMGTIYKKEELKSLKSICEKYNLYLYIDGARLGYALMAPSCDYKKEELKDLCDAFYIGGTKLGLLFGEALVFTGSVKADHIFTSIKRNGALLAKGFVAGIEFDEMFKDDFYFKVAKDAVNKALYLRDKILSKGYKLYMDSDTNQQFFIVSKEKYNELKDKVLFNLWDKIDSSTFAIRLVISPFTKDVEIEELLKLF